MTKEQKQIEHIMKCLDCTEEEARDVIATDYIIDHGGRTPYDIDPKLEKEMMKLANINSRKSQKADNQRGKVKRAQPGKEEIIKFLAETLRNAGYLNIKVENPTKIITFSAKTTDEKTNQDKILNFKLDLSAPRAKKS